MILSNVEYLGENMTRYNIGEYKMKAGKEKKDKLESFTAPKDFTRKASRCKWVHQKKSMALKDLFGFSDAYMTLADNYYLYNNPEQPGKMIYMSFDLDTIIGSTLFDLDFTLSGDYTKHPEFSFQSLTKHLFANPDVLQQYKGTILKLAKELIQPSIMMPRIDNVVDMIRSDVEWDQSLSRVRNNLECDTIKNSSTRFASYWNEEGVWLVLSISIRTGGEWDLEL
ncbi:hypothetical protein K501DRAFT_300771 [Backusella circina FSU 941]|nr:hypothetical protein K501DRAFT_300771 [Backusella circina FSU 941]